MIEFETQGRVALISINRPDARNAVNGDVARGIEAALDRLEADAELWVGVITGRGTAFSAGADLKAVSAGQGATLATERGGFAGIVQRELEKPLIAAVDGPALAGGCEIALACDLIVASRRARFGLPEVKRSLIAAAGGLFRLPRVLPPRIAMELALTGDSIDAERAYHFGFVNALTEPGEALAGALALAERIIENAPLAVRESRRILRKALASDEALLWQETFGAFGRIVSSEDFREGPLAFIEKRPPVWKGR
jgi:enoyl-CoA hydratase